MSERLPRASTAAAWCLIGFLGGRSVGLQHDDLLVQHLHGPARPRDGQRDDGALIDRAMPPGVAPIAPCPPVLSPPSGARPQRPALRAPARGLDRSRHVLAVVRPAWRLIVRGAHRRPVPPDLLGFGSFPACLGPIRPVSLHLDGLLGVIGPSLGLFRPNLRSICTLLGGPLVCRRKQEPPLTC